MLRRTLILVKRGLPVLSGLALLAVLAAPLAGAGLGDGVPRFGAPEPPCAATADDLGIAFEEVAKALTPSVVKVSSVERIGVVRPVPGPFFGLRPFQEPGRDLFRQGLGSGFVVSEDGYILTNHHVVRGADQVTVAFTDGRSYEAEVVGGDPKTDVAVLKIDAEGLKPVYFGDSDALQVGQWVAAIGNPFGLSSTMTAGIVSAVGRSHVGLADYEDFIQTDAAINPGNSGGPLVNLRGEVVGINTAIFSRSGGSIGIGFAIPMNMARSVMESLIETGHVERGWLGVLIQNLNEDLAGSFGYESTKGALVGDVTAGGPAEKAGIRPGDIIVRFGDQEVEDVDELRLAVAETQPGTAVQVEVFRDGERRTLDVEVGRLEDAGEGGVFLPEELGLRLQTLTPELADRLDLPANAKGVVVVEVDPTGAAARAGLRPEDVIQRVDGKSVENVNDFERILRDSDLSRGVRLTVRTQGMRRFVFLRMKR